MKIVVGASSFAKQSPEPLELIRGKGYEIILNPYGRKMDGEEIITFLKGADGILAGLEPLDSTVLESTSGKLKAIARIGTGMDNVDSEAARRLGIKVSNTPDAPTSAVAEMTLAAALTLCRRILPANDDMHQCKWNKILGRSLDGAKVLIIGYGRIGRRVADLFRTFGSTITAYDPNLPDFSGTTLEELLPHADIVSIHASGKSVIIGEKQLELMRPHSLLLNAGRGGLIDENALNAALDDGRIGGCWLDVFSEEPYSGELCDKSNALLTPHLSTYTDKCRLDMEMQAVRNLLRDLGDE